jgi:hypothetical protein
MTIDSLAQPDREVKEMPSGVLIYNAPRHPDLVTTLQEAMFGQSAILHYDECAKLESAERLALHWQQRARREDTRFARKMAGQFTEEALRLADEFGQPTVVQAWEDRESAV